MLNKEQFYQSMLGRCSIILYGLFIIFFDAFATCFVWHKSQEKQRKRLLLVRMDAIGDFILWQPAAVALRELYPAEHWDITLAANQSWVILAQQAGLFDQVFPIHYSQLHRNLIYRFKVLRWLGAQGFDVSINPVYSRELLCGDALIRASKAKQKIGWQGDRSNLHPWLKKMTDTWYNQLIRNTSVFQTELKRNADFISALGGGNAFQQPVLKIKHESSTVLPDKPYFVLFPGASWQGKQWSVTNFSELAFKIIKQTGWQLVICGGHADIEVGVALRKSCFPAALCLVGKTELDELANIIAHAQLLVSNDTGAAHIGAAVGTDTVCIAGGGHFGRFVPYDTELKMEHMRVVNQAMSCYGCNWQCIYPRDAALPVPCIAEISVNQVWQVVEGIIQKPAAKVKAGCPQT
ncbi:MAG: glycosyltransferase family 9 protein [Methylococcaceae bacterium]|jgi:ADP-heptose:LPS heptosyltransferase